MIISLLYRFSKNVTQLLSERYVCLVWMQPPSGNGRHWRGGRIRCMAGLLFQYLDSQTQIFCLYLFLIAGLDCGYVWYLPDPWFSMGNMISGKFRYEIYRVKSTWMTSVANNLHVSTLVTEVQVCHSISEGLYILTFLYKGPPCKVNIFALF